MTTIEILQRATELHVRLVLVGDKIRMIGPVRAVDELIPDVTAHKSEMVAYLRAAVDGHEAVPADCIGALHAADGGLFLPWGPCLWPDEVRRGRDELSGLIVKLAELERWPDTLRDSILSRAMSGPLADLLPNLHYFRERVTVARDEAAMRVALAARAWRYDPARRGR
jgi:hypothetical protein